MAAHKAENWVLWGALRATKVAGQDGTQKGWTELRSTGTQGQQQAGKRPGAGSCDPSLVRSETPSPWPGWPCRAPELGSPEPRALSPHGVSLPGARTVTHSPLSPVSQRHGALTAEPRAKRAASPESWERGAGPPFIPSRLARPPSPPCGSRARRARAGDGPSRSRGHLLPAGSGPACKRRCLARVPPGLLFLPLSPLPGPARTPSAGATRPAPRPDLRLGPDPRRAGAQGPPGACMQGESGRPTPQPPRPARSLTHLRGL